MTLLLGKEIPGLFYEGDVRIAVLDDTTLLFVTEDDAVFAFDVNTSGKIKFDPPDKTVKSSITSIAINPSHDLVVVGYSDGAIQPYAYPNPKAQKLFTKPEKGDNVGIVSMQFIDQYTIIYLTRGNLIFSLDASPSVFKMLKRRETFLTQIENMCFSLSVPPIFQNTTAQGAKPSFAFTMPSLQGLSFLSTMTNFVVSNTTATTYDIITQYQASAATIGFHISEDNIMLGIHADNTLRILTIKNTSSPEEVSTIDVEANAACVAFLSSSMVAIADIDGSCSLVSIPDKKVTQTKLPHDGFPIAGSNSIIVFKSGEAYNVTLPSFNDLFIELQNNDNLEGAREVSLRAISGDPASSVGLPSNSRQRFLLVQRAFMEFFGHNIEERLSNKSTNTKALFEECVKTAKEMQLPEWITVRLRALFKDAGKDEEYFKYVVETDPTASLFPYSRDFLADLVDASASIDLTGFLANLPSIVAPPEIRVRYGMIKKDYRYVSNVYLNDLQDPISAAAILEKADLIDAVVDVLTQCITSEWFGPSVKWLLARSANGRFERCERLASKSDVVAPLLRRIGEMVKESNQPISYDAFANAVFAICADGKFDVNSGLALVARDIVLNDRVNFSQPSVKYLLGVIFGDKIPEPDRRERMLVALLPSLSSAAVESLMPVCEAFGFSAARGEILSREKKYDIAIAEMLQNKDADVYGFVQQKLSTEPDARDAICKAFKTQTSLLFAKDPEQFLDVIQNHFSDLSMTAIKLLDKRLVNYYIKVAIEKGAINPSEIDGELSVNYVDFLCRFFPGIVIDFIRHHNDMLDQYQRSCEANSVLDGLAYIGHVTGHSKVLCANLVKHLKVIALRLADGQLAPSDFERAFEFDSTMLSKSIKAKLPGVETLATDMVTAVAAPLFAIQQSSSEKEEVKTLLKSALRKLCVIASDAVGFEDVIKLLLAEFPEVHIGLVREALSTVIMDYTYDVESSSALGILFTEDMQRAYDNYVGDLSKGVRFANITCDACGKRLEGDKEVRVFKCGHVFHNESACCAREICPVCNREERLDDKKKDESVAPLTTNQRQIIRRMQTFERRMTSGLCLDAMWFDDMKAEEVVSAPVSDVVVSEE